METTNGVKKEKQTLDLKTKALDIFSKYSMVIILIGLLIAFQLMTDGIFWRPLNITNIVLQNSHILVLAAGMLLVVLLGHVDLSVGSVMAFVGAISGILMVNFLPIKKRYSSMARILIKMPPNRLGEPRM